MPKDAGQVLKDALTLPAEAWKEEIIRRLREIDSGDVELIPGEVAQRRLWSKLESGWSGPSRSTRLLKETSH